MSKTENKNANYKARIAESIVEVFFTKTNHLVLKYGVENSVNTITQINTECTNENAREVMSKIMTMPDFIVTKLEDDNHTKFVFLVEVKFRTFKNKKEFDKHLQEGGEIYEQAKKYKDLWGGVVHIFLIAKIGNEVSSYYDTANYIVDHKEIKQLNTDNYKWIDAELLEEYREVVSNTFR